MGDGMFQVMMPPKKKRRLKDMELPHCIKQISKRLGCEDVLLGKLNTVVHTLGWWS